MASGVTILWNEDYTNCEKLVKGESSISCLFKNCRGGLTWAFLGVYCRGNREEKDILWKELDVCRTKWGSNWIVGGDFNMVLRKGERSRTCSASEINEFKDEVNSLELIDFPLSGCQ